MGPRQVKYRTMMIVFQDWIHLQFMSHRLRIEMKDIVCQTLLKRKENLSSGAPCWTNCINFLLHAATFRTRLGFIEIKMPLYPRIAHNVVLVAMQHVAPLICPCFFLPCSVLWRRHRRRHRPHPGPAGRHHRPHRVLPEAQDEPPERQERGRAAQRLRCTTVCAYGCVRVGVRVADGHVVETCGTIGLCILVSNTGMDLLIVSVKLPWNMLDMFPCFFKNLFTLQNKLIQHSCCCCTR